MGTTIKDYARSRGISHEAVRRQLKRYSEELEGHITQQGRSKYLDDEAVEFLDQHRLPKTIVIDPTDEEAKQEIEDLKGKLDLMKSQVLSLQEQIINLQSEKIDLIADQTRNQLLLESKDKETADLQGKLETMDQDNRNLQSQIENKNQENRDLQSRLEEAEKEANRYSKTWFGLYRRKDS